MKTIQFFTLCTLFFIGSCNKNKVNDISNGDIITKNNLDMLIVASNVTQVSDSNIIASLDLTSYNPKTGELIFRNENEIMNKIKELRSKVNVYVKGKYQFSLIFASDLLSDLYNKPVLYYSLMNTNAAQQNKWYIYNGYPWGTPLGAPSSSSVQSETYSNERILNFKKIEQGWSLFMEELKKEGKYIN